MDHNKKITVFLCVCVCILQLNLFYVDTFDDVEGIPYGK